MKLRNYLFLISCSLFVLTSCVSVKNSTSIHSSEEIKIDNSNSILGIYKNIPTNAQDFTDEQASLWKKLNYSSKKTHEKWKELNVSILDKNGELYAELRNNDEVLETKKISGQIHNGYYLLKNQYKFKTMLIYLINGLGQSSVKMTKNENKLLVLEKIQGVGLIVVVPGFAAGGNLRESEFEKLK